jgi:CRP-like cAMP-binding protein
MSAISQEVVTGITARCSESRQNRYYAPGWGASMSASQNEIQALIAVAKRKVFRSSNVLFAQGDSATGVFVVCRGSVRLFIRNPVSGKITFDRCAGPGSLLGLPAVFGDKPYSMSAEAVEESEVGFLPREKFLSLMQEDGRLCMRCLQLLSDEVRVARAAVAL